MGLLHNFNDMDVNQSQDIVEITCQCYIDCFLCSHNWKANSLLSECPLSSLLKYTVHQMTAEVLSPSNGGHTEHTSEFSTESVPIEYTQQTVTASQHLAQPKQNSLPLLQQPKSSHQRLLICP